MSTKKERESMENLERCYKIVQQSSAKGGISAIEISEKTGIHRATVHRHLTSLALMGKVESQQGLWVAKTGEQTIKPLEKEIVIKLPIPKSEQRRMILLKNSASMFGRMNDPDNIFKISLDVLEETRTIRVIGKNVDDLSLQKISELVKEATESSYKIKLKNLFKKAPKPNQNKSNSIPK